MLLFYLNSYWKNTQRKKKQKKKHFEIQISNWTDKNLSFFKVQKIKIKLV